MSYRVLLGSKAVRQHKIKVSYGGTQYRVVFKLDSQRREVGVIFLGTRQNFYRELKRYLG